jgi:uncharacterized membrane protein
MEWAAVQVAHSTIRRLSGRRCAEPDSRLDSVHNQNADFGKPERKRPMASNLTVIVFDNMEEADKVHDSLVSAKKQGFTSIDDSAVIVKDEKGKVHVNNQLDRGVKVGAVGGSLLGLLLAGIFFPFAGLILGGLAGAGIGALMNVGIPKNFVKEVSEKIEKGTSALFVITRDSDPDMIAATLRPYKGEVLQTSLDTEQADQLRETLSKRI